jgi:putative N6-adenine-specific DNA methylase
VLDIVVKTFLGVEETLAAELRELGATDVEILKRAVACKGDVKLVYKINYMARTALRVLLPIAKFKARSEESLYHKMKKIDWTQYMSLSQTFAITSAVNSKYFNHSQYVALKTKDAIVDQFREKFFKRPNVNTETPHLAVNVHIYMDDVTVSLDTSGQSLHKRGYRKESFVAPINEALAASLVMMTGWRGEKTFIDPMCGSGTILAEAAMIATNTPPQIHRDYFSFKKGKGFDPVIWREVVSEANENIKAPECKIWGFDNSFQTIHIAERNLEHANMDDFVQLKRKAFEKNSAPDNNGILVTNPPYGERIETSEDIIEFYQMIGTQLKHNFHGYTAWLISSNFEALKLLGLKPSRKIALYNGALQCKFQRYDLYAGSKKAKKQEGYVEAPEIQEIQETPEIQENQEAPEIQENQEAPEIQENLETPEIQENQEAPEIQENQEAPEIQNEAENKTED